MHLLSVHLLTSHTSSEHQSTLAAVPSVPAAAAMIPQQFTWLTLHTTPEGSMPFGTR